MAIFFILLYLRKRKTHQFNIQYTYTASCRMKIHLKIYYILCIHYTVYYTETNTLKNKSQPFGWQVNRNQTKERDRDKMKQKKKKKPKTKWNEKRSKQSIIIIILYYYYRIVFKFNSMRHMMKLIKLIDFLYNFDNKSCVLLATLPHLLLFHVISVVQIDYFGKCRLADHRLISVVRFA